MSERCLVSCGVGRDGVTSWGLLRRVSKVAVMFMLWTIYKIVQWCIVEGCSGDVCVYIKRTEIQSRCKGKVVV
jgi:hypothetical protein